MRRFGTRAALAVALTALAAAAPLTLRPASADASADQLAIFEDETLLVKDPAGTLLTLRSLGVDTVRVLVRWRSVAPDPDSHRAPRGFDATQPAAYPGASWAHLDTVVQDAHADGIGIDFLLTGGAPNWASAPGAPRGGEPGVWKPSASAFGQFVTAVGTRYSGGYRPAGMASPLPRLSLWEIWNEPNFGQNLAPQATHGSRISTSPRIYRGLLDAAWSALGRTGHGGDTVVIGNTSPRGFLAGVSRKYPQGLPGFWSTTKPLSFTRTLYCVDQRDRPLRGGAAARVGCPTSTAGSRRFRSANPALFGAPGVGIHPYPYNLPPTRADSPDPDYAEFSELPRLSRTVDQLERVYGSRTRPQIYNTEYGYITDPPNHKGAFVSPTTAAYYLNWAEFISYRNPRIASISQYLLNDPNPAVSGFATGLRFYNGRDKPTYDAYRMPVYLPVTSLRPHRTLEVWGCVRPAGFARHDIGTVQYAQVQYSRGSSGGYETIDSVAVTNPRGYFDVHVKFPAGGEVRIAWTDPAGETIYSRTVNVRST